MRGMPLNYLSPDTPRARRRWPWGMLGTLAIVLFVAGEAQTLEVRQVESRVDAVTGSMAWKTVWIFGLSSGTRVEVSPLEKRLTQSGIPWTRSWRFLSSAHHNVFGGTTGVACVPAPAIYLIRPVLKPFAAASTDAELRAFVRVMQTGTEAEREAAVDAAGEKGLQALSAKLGGG